MPFVDPLSSTRFDSPHAPGEWFRIRPSTAGDTAKIAETQGKSTYPVTVRILALTIVEWSFDAPITEENVGNLDPQTYQWLMSVDAQVSGQMDAAEKKEPTSEPSADTWQPEQADASHSPPALVTSSSSNGLEITA